ncbi:Cytochrome B561 [gamma proteobacterium HdN1]|nr:Cytochrome B561 [gamma proteobacterium HdN1]
MGWKSTELRYGSLSIGIHWLTALLILGVYVFIELQSWFPKGSDTRALMKTWHFQLGLTVFFITLVRIAVRVMGPTPRIIPEIPAWQHWLSKAVQLALYAGMVLLPFAGWMMLSAAGKPVPFFGLELPHLIGENSDLAGQIKETHELIGKVGMFVIGLHTVAALYHHYFMHDNTLLRMLPERKDS